MTNDSHGVPRVAIVGAGPSGCFLAGAIRRALPAARIFVLDRLPTPFGLVRYGVASDHQSTKAIVRQFDRLFTREGVEFAGNVLVTNEDAGEGTVTLAELRERADVVVLATGLASDRPLSVPGGDLPEVFGSGTITRLLNSHPDSTHSRETVSRFGKRTAIIGLGNVAVDLIRFLVKRPEDFDGSDVNDEALTAYAENPVEQIEVFSRSSIDQAKCDAQLIREISKISGVHCGLYGATDVDASELPRVAQSRVDALRELAADSLEESSARVRVRVHFGYVPERILGEGQVEALVAGPSVGTLVENGAGNVTVDVDSVISAIGFDADEFTLEKRPPGEARIAPGLYRVGWLRRGPQGTIPENRADAVAVAQLIVEDLSAADSSILRSAGAEGAAGEPLLPERAAKNVVEYSHWSRIDEQERSRARPGRVRTKLPTTRQLLTAAGITVNRDATTAAEHSLEERAQ